MPFPETFTAPLVARRHSALLIAIVVLFAVRPFLGDTGAGTIAFSLVILVVLLAALFAIQVDDMAGERTSLLAQRRRRRLVGWVLAALAITERVWLLLSPSRWLLQLGSFSWLVFFAFVVWSLLRSLLKQRAVTGETISMSISVYLLLGLTWGLLYIVIFTRNPEAFSFGKSPLVGEQQILPLFIYFSLTTLSTIGFGDITPLTLQARYAAVAEGITGQFYLAILVARLVGMQMTQAASTSTSSSPATGVQPRTDADRQS